MTVAKSQYSESDLKIIESGRLAYAAGIMKCPFAVGSKANRLWRKGWHEAKFLQGRSTIAA